MCGLIFILFLSVFFVFFWLFAAWFFFVVSFCGLFFVHGGCFVSSPYAGAVGSVPLGFFRPLLLMGSYRSALCCAAVFWKGVRRGLCGAVVAAGRFF